MNKLNIRGVSSISLLLLLTSTLSLSRAFDFADFENGISGIFEKSLDQIDQYFGAEVEDEVDIEFSAITCSSCKVAMKSFDAIFQSDKCVASIEDFAVNICLKYLTYGEEVCNQMVDRMAPIIIHVVANSFLSSDYMCAEILGTCTSPTYTKEYAKDYAAAMIASKPDLIQNNNFINDLYAQIKADTSPRKTFKIAHVSDLHMDYSFVPSAEQPFGHRGTETPYVTLVAMMTYIKEQIEPDFLVWTGDNSRSNTWANTLDEVIDYTVNITETIKAVGLDKVTTMYPIEGNHDTFPVNVEDFTHEGDDEAINAFKSHWEEWLDVDQFEIFSKFGYYSQPLRTVTGQEVENVVIIGLNTQACNNENWYLIENRYDPGDQLAFVVSELSRLEQVGGSAIFISHIPPASCLHPWGERFRSITERYQHVIKFSLYGHTHKEMFEVTRSISDNKNIGMNYITGSMTTESAFPCITVVEVDAEFMVPLNFNTYIMDLDESNAQNTPIIKFFHGFVEEYQLADASPDSLYELAERILNDEATAMQYDWNKHRQFIDNKPTSCDELCRRTLYCEVSSTEEVQYEECTKTMPNIKGGALFDIVLNALTDPWLIKSK